MQINCLSYKLREMILLKSCRLMICDEMESEIRFNVDVFVRLASVCDRFYEIVRGIQFGQIIRQTVKGLSALTDFTLVQTLSL